MKSLFCITDNPILAFTKQAALDLVVYEASYVAKAEVLKTVKELADKANQLYQKRQGELD
jgi:hypothetical protein